MKEEGTLLNSFYKKCYPDTKPDKGITKKCIDHYPSWIKTQAIFYKIISNGIQQYIEMIIYHDQIFQKYKSLIQHLKINQYIVP